MVKSDPGFKITKYKDALIKSFRNSVFRGKNIIKIYPGAIWGMNIKEARK
jgi:hypothetical protein